MSYTVISRGKEKHVHSTPGLFGSRKFPEGSIIQCDCGQKLECVFSGWADEIVRTWRELDA